jgi:hypothetical protein
MSTISPASGITSCIQYEPERLDCVLDRVADDSDSSWRDTAVASSTSGSEVAGGCSGSSTTTTPVDGVSGLGGSQVRQKTLRAVT